MQIKNFKVEYAEDHGELKTLLVPTLGFQAIVKDIQIHNVEPFTLTVDERGMIYNYIDRVKVSMVNRKTLRATWDTMSILSIANTPAVQQVINQSLGITDSFDKWDAAIEQAEKVNNRVPGAVNQVEVEMIMDDIRAYHLQQAIDRALDSRDKEMFHRLVQIQRGGVAQ